MVPAGRVAVGMQLPIQSQSSLYAEPWERDAGPDELRRVALAAEDAGFLYVAVCDHVAIPRERAESMGTAWYDTVAALGYLAAATERVRLLSHVYVPVYRHPLQVAKSFATLDHLSKGRVILGVGAGHVEGEFATLGVDFGERGRLLDESIDALRAAFADEFPEFAGQHWKFADAGVRPRPAQERLPIWVGGSSKPAMRRAAERGDGWLPQGTTLKELPDAYRFVREHRAATRGDEPIVLGSICGSLYVGDPDWDVGPYTYRGPAEKVAGFLRRFHEAGADQVQVRFRSRSVDELCDQIATFGDQVVPRLDA